MGFNSAFKGLNKTEL